MARVVAGASILLITLMALGIGAGRGVASAQGSPPPAGGGTMDMMNMMGGMGMMGGPSPAAARPLSMDQAVEILRQWPAAHHLEALQLVLDEVEAYTQNFYGQFKESSSGRGAIQVLVDRYSGRAMPEMGPNVMWNTKYGRQMMQEMMDGMGMPGMMSGSTGMMGGPGMMGSGMAPATGDASATARVSADQARQLANQFLAGYYPGAHVRNADTFYGYYHFDVLRAGRQVGMLSVSADTGQVWYHTWHGEFLDKREIAHP